MKKISLTKIKPGTKSKVLEVHGGPALQNRLMSIGVYPGREIAKLGHFALRGPVTIKVGRAVVALGHGMASKIIVETE
jgi:ferrous iron transport protein A